MDKNVLQSGELSVFTDEKKVLVRGEQVPLPALSYKLLIRLMQSWPETVSQNDLLNDVWGDVCVQNNTLNQRVKLLRQSLKAAGIDTPCIDLERGLGFRFAQRVEKAETSNKLSKKTSLGSIKPLNKSNSKVKLSLIAGIFAALGTGGFLLFSNLVYSNLNSQQSTQQPTTADATLITMAVQTVIQQPSGINNLSESVAQEIVSVLTEVNRFSIIDQGLVNSPFQDQSWLPSNSNLETPSWFTQISLNTVQNNFQIRVEVKQLNKSEPVWQNVYNVDRDDVYFSKFDIVSDLKSALLPHDRQQIKYRTAPNLLNPTAYDLYLRSKNYQERNTPRDNVLAHELLAEAYQLSPSCLDIMTGYANVLADGVRYGHVTPTALKTIETLGQKAKQLFPHVAKSYLGMGYFHLAQSQWLEAKTEFNKALKIQPHLKEALVGLTQASLALGEFDVAITQIETLKLTTPNATDAIVLNAHLLKNLQLTARALKEYQKVLRVEPDNLEAALGLAEISLERKAFGEFWQQIERISKYSSSTTKQVELELRAMFLQRKFTPLLAKYEQLQNSDTKHRFNDKTLNLVKGSQLLAADKINEPALFELTERIKNQINHSNLALEHLEILLVLMKDVASKEDVLTWQKEKEKRIARLQMTTFSS